MHKPKNENEQNNSTSSNEGDTDKVVDYNETPKISKFGMLRKRIRNGIEIKDMSSSSDSLSSIVEKTQRIDG